MYRQDYIQARALAEHDYRQVLKREAIRPSIRRTATPATGKAAALREAREAAAAAYDSATWRSKQEALQDVRKAAQAAFHASMPAGRQQAPSMEPRPVMSFSAGGELQPAEGTAWTPTRKTNTNTNNFIR